MSVGMGAVRHARGRYRKLFDAVLRPVRKVEAKAHHLHELEQTGDSGETPLIAILGLFLFLLPIFLLMLGLALGAAWLIG